MHERRKFWVASLDKLVQMLLKDMNIYCRFVCSIKMSSIFDFQMVLKQNIVLWVRHSFSCSRPSS